MDLEADGETKGEGFVSDQIKINTKGYEVWNGIIKDESERVKDLN